MKVAQEIDVDNVTIIINSDNKLQAVVSNPVEGEPSTFNLIEPQLSNHYDFEWEDIVYQIEGTDKFIKGTKLVKALTKNSWTLFNIIRDYNAQVTYKELRNVESDSKWGYSGKEYEVKNVFTYNINLSEAAEKSYNENDLDNFINSITTVVKNDLLQNKNSQLENEQIGYLLDSSIDTKIVKHSNYVEVTVTEIVKLFLEETYIQYLEYYVKISEPNRVHFNPIKQIRLKTKETYLGVPVYIVHENY